MFWSLSQWSIQINQYIFFIIQQLQESLSKSKKMEDELRQEITRLMEEFQKQPHESKVSYLNYKNISKKKPKALER